MTSSLPRHCEFCGHSLAVHAASDHDTPEDVCTMPLDTFPDGGFHGVCPCVRSSHRQDIDHMSLMDVDLGDDPRV